MYFYLNDIKGDNDQKFEYFKEIVGNSDDLQQLMIDENIEMPSEASSVTGFLEDLSEE